MVRKCINGIFFLLTLLGMLSILLILVPYLFKIKPQIVLSGSMEPEISVGSLVYISENIPPEEIQEQDVIAYRRGEQMQVLHRVIQVDEKKKMFQTKGDANENADPGMVDFSQYVGKEVFSISVSWIWSGFYSDRRESLLAWRGDSDFVGDGFFVVQKGEKSKQ